MVAEEVCLLERRDSRRIAGRMYLELGRVVLGAFLIGMRYSSAYGAVGSFIAILLWCYYGISILFFGAEYVQVLQLRRAGVPTTGPGQLSANLPIDQNKSQVVASSPSEQNDAPEPRISEQEISSTRPLFVLPADAPRQRPRRAPEHSNSSKIG